MAFIFSHSKHNKSKHSKADGKTPEIAAIAQMDGSDGNILASIHEDGSAQRGGIGWSITNDIDSDFDEYDSLSNRLHPSFHQDWSVQRGGIGWSAQRGGIGWSAPNGFDLDFDEYDAHSVAMASLSMSLPLMCEHLVR